jgi:hypothetical protein
MAEHLTTDNNIDILHLLALGFTEAEAVNLVYMKNHVSEQSEYREMLEESRRLNFVRWLIEHNRLSH